MLRYTRLDALSLVRSAYFLVFSVAFSAGFYIMFTVVVSDALSNSPSFARDYMVAMSVSGAFFGALNAGGIRLGMERGDGWTRQVLLTPLSGSAYLGSKALSAWVLTLPAVVVVFLLGGLVNGVSMTPARWVGTVLVLWLGSLAFVMTGVAVGLVAAGERTQFVALAVFFPFAMLGGLWFPIDSFPQALRQTVDYLPTRALYQLADSVAGGAPTIHTKPILVLVGWTVALAALVLSRSRPAVLVRL